jgi:MATE family multidrug resistance protein
MSDASALHPWRTELRATLLLALPLAATNLLQMLIHAVDVIFIARLGDQQLAASSLGIAVFGLTMWAMTGLTGACAPLIAAELGRRAHSVREVRRTVRMALWVSFGFGLIGMAIGFAGEAILLASGQNAEVAALAGKFLGILSWAMIPMIAASVFRIFVAALGKPGYATAITLLALGTNILGNWVLVFGNLGAPALGLEGSALSSVITSLAMLAAYVVVIGRDRQLRRYRIFGRWWRGEWQRLRQIMVIGTPIALTVLAEAGLFSGAALLMGRAGRAHARAQSGGADFPDSFRHRPGRDDPGRLSLWRARPGCGRTCRLGGAGGLGVVHGHHGRCDAALPPVHPLALCRSGRAAQRRAGGFGGAVPGGRRSIPAVRRRPGGCRRRAARSTGYPGAARHRAVRILGGRLRYRDLAGLLHPAGRPGGVDRARAWAGGGGDIADLALA